MPFNWVNSNGSCLYCLFKLSLYFGMTVKVSFENTTFFNKTKCFSISCVTYFVSTHPLVFISTALNNDFFPLHNERTSNWNPLLSVHIARGPALIIGLRVVEPGMIEKCSSINWRPWNSKCTRINSINLFISSFTLVFIILLWVFIFIQTLFFIKWGVFFLFHMSIHRICINTLLIEFSLSIGSLWIKILFRCIYSYFLNKNSIRLLLFINRFSPNFNNVSSFNNWNLNSCSFWWCRVRDLSFDDVPIQLDNYNSVFVKVLWLILNNKKCSLLFWWIEFLKDYFGMFLGGSWDVTFNWISVILVFHSLPCCGFWVDIGAIGDMSAKVNVVKDGEGIVGCFHVFIILLIISFLLKA